MVGLFNGYSVRAVCAKQGLYLASPFPSVLLRPLFIPWADIRLVRLRQWGVFRFAELSIGEPLAAVFGISMPFLERIRGHLGSQDRARLDSPGFVPSPAGPALRAALAVAASLMAPVVLIRSHVFDLSRARRLARESVPVEATVTDVSRGSESTTTRYEYRVQSLVYKGEMFRLHEPGQFWLGEKVKAYYLPDQPATSCLGRPDSEYRSYVVDLLGLWFIAALCLFGVLSWAI